MRSTCALSFYITFSISRSVSDILVKGTCNLVLLYPILPSFSHNASTHRVLEKKGLFLTKKRIIVVRDGGRDHRRPVARLRAPQDPVVAAKSSGKRHDDHKKMKKQGVESA